MNPTTEIEAATATTNNDKKETRAINIICSEQSSSRYPNRHRRTRPKKRKLQQQHDLLFHPGDNNDENATYEINPKEVLSICEGVKLYKRPLPSMTTMAALASASQQPKQQQQQQQERMEPTTKKKKKSNNAIPSIPILHSFIKVIDENKASSVKVLTTGESHNEEEHGPLLFLQNNINTPSQQQSQSSFSSYIDNRNASTITEGQCLRYQHLLLKKVHLASSSSSQIKSKIKEYKTLEKCIKEEQIRYCQALMEYRDCVCLNRFLIGFKVPGPASNFVTTNSQIIQSYKKRWEINTKQQQILESKNDDDNNSKHHHHHYPQPTKYHAKHSQSISLSKLCARYNETEFHPPYIACQNNVTDRSSSSSSRSFDIDSYSSRILKTVSGTNIPKTNLQWFQSPSSAKKGNVNTKLNPPISIPLKPNKCIINDTIAKSLAIKHDVNVVLTSETFEALLQRPGYEGTRWMIPIVIERKKDVWVDEDVTDDDDEKGKTEQKPVNATGGKSSTKTIAFMEEPIPQASTPRECLTRGFEQSLLENFGNVSSSSSSSKRKDDTMDQDDCLQYVYTLLTLPSSGKMHQRHTKATAAAAPFRVLVRSTNTLLADDDDDENGEDNAGTNKDNDSNQSESSTTTTTKPVHIRAQLEYFHQDRKGNLEEYTQHDRSIWIMNKLLQPKSRTIIGRIDPNTATIIKWEEKTIADALIGVVVNDATSAAMMLSSSTALYAADFDPCAHFRVVEEVVRATGKIGLGQYLLCYPGRGVPPSSVTSLSALKTSVSVHKAFCGGDDGASGSVDKKDGSKDGADVDVHSTKKSEDCIDVGKELIEAEAVYMGQQSLKLCFRPWVWGSDDGRLPFTFPMKVDE